MNQCESVLPHPLVAGGPDHCRVCARALPLLCPMQAFNFAFFSLFQQHLAPDTSLLPMMACGGLAGAASLCVIYPLEAARRMLAVDARVSAAVSEYVRFVSGVSVCDGMA